MRRAPALRIDPIVARTAFALSRGTCGTAITHPQASLELRRDGCDDVVRRVVPLEVDADGRLVFAWGDCLHGLPMGLYRARLASACTDCGELLMDACDDCTITTVENIAFNPPCDGPDDTCAMTTICAPAGPCAPAPLIYVPPYDVPRGC